MKKYILLCCYLLTGLSFLWGQEDACVDSVGISTDPRPGKAYNNERGAEFANTFNWMDPVYSPTHFAGGPLQGITYFNSPFYNNNYFLNFLAHQENSDFYPEDGWELVHWGFGKKLDGSNDSYDRELLYLMLYNRHSGMIHVFGATYLVGYNVYGIELRITPDAPGGRLNYKPNGLFGYFQPVSAQVLDEPTTVTSVRANSKHSNQYKKLVHAAFPLAYDPCVCHNLSGLQVWFHAVDMSEITLSGRLLGTSTSVEDYPNGSSPDFHPDWLNAVTEDETNVVAGMQVYRHAGDLYDELRTEMNAKGKLDIVAALDVLKAALDLGAEIPPLKPLKIAAKGVNFAQSVVKFKKSLDPPKPSLSLPALIRGEMVLSGTIVDGDDQKVSEIAVPGSKNSWDLPEANYPAEPYYPLYNEELGVFALIETPVVERYVSTETTYGPVCLDYGQQGEPPLMEITQENASYRFAESLKYAINPAARIDLGNSDISVALMIKRPFPADENSSSHYSSSQIQLGNLEEGVGDYTYISPFLPVECLESLTMYIERTNEKCESVFYSSGPDTLYLIFANTYLSSTLGKDGLPIVSQQILTFPVIIQQVSSPLPNSPQIPFEVSVSGALTSDVRAWNRIEITGNASAVSPVQLIAGNEIVIDPTVTLSPNLELIAGSFPITCGTANPPQTPEQLHTWCQSNHYKANQLSSLGRQYLANVQAHDSLRHLPMPPTFSLTAQPNPFDEHLTLRYELPEAGQVSLLLLDLMGRPVTQVQQTQEMPSGPQEVVVDTRGLAAGMYHAVLQAGKRRQSVKVVKP